MHNLIYCRLANATDLVRLYVLCFPEHEIAKKLEALLSSASSPTQPVEVGTIFILVE